MQREKEDHGNPLVKRIFHPPHPARPLFLSLPLPSSLHLAVCTYIDHRYASLAALSLEFCSLTGQKFSLSPLFVTADTRSLFQNLSEDLQESAISLLQLQ